MVNVGIPERLPAARKPLIAAASQGQVLRKVTLDGHSFAGLNLKKTQFIRSFLRRVDFSGADLSGGSFFKSILTEANLAGAILKGADLRGAFFRGANLGGADLTGALLHEVNLYGARFFINGQETVYDETTAPAIRDYLTKTFAVTF